MSTVMMQKTPAQYETDQSAKPKMQVESWNLGNTTVGTCESVIVDT